MANTKFGISADPVGRWEDSDMIPKDCFTTKDKTELNETFFASDDEKTLVGIWECAPCKMKIEDRPFDEKMTIIFGSVTLTNEDGVAETFKSGDVLFTSKGSTFTWEITERLRKFYMICW